MAKTTRVWVAVCAAVTTLGVAAAAAQAGPEVVGLSVDVYGESSGLNGHQNLDVMESNESFDYGAGPFALRTWVKFPWKTRLQWGAGLAWRGRYSAELENDQAFVFGQLTELYGQIDYGIPFHKKWTANFSGRVGLATLFPEGDFSNEIERLQDGDVGVWSGPRFGWLIGATAGVRYPLTKRITLVGDLGLEAERIYLFHTQDTVGDVHVEKSWRNEVTRVSVSFGMEVGLP